MVDVCIVGAGLSGAYAARKLLSIGKSVTVIDARSRIGGRLLSNRGSDLGGAWAWPRQEYVMNQFLQEMDIQTVPMHMDGKTLIRTSDGKRHILPDGESERYAACGGGAVRICGGADSMVNKLFSDDAYLSIHLNSKVIRIEHNNDNNLVNVVYKKKKSETDQDDNTEEIIECRACILAAPPKLIANTVEFKPKLSKMKMDAMLATPTWMESYGKVSVSYPTNWWRESNQSAISIDQIGAVSTWWEASSGVDEDGDHPSLAGFVSQQHGAKMLEDMEPNALYNHVIGSLKDIYGIDPEKDVQQNAEISIEGSADREGIIISKNGITVIYKSWLKDSYTNDGTCTDDIAFTTTDYGDSQLQESVQSLLFFAGTETSHGSGHMEGAIISGNRVAEEVLKHLT